MHKKTLRHLPFFIAASLALDTCGKDDLNHGL